MYLGDGLGSLADGMLGEFAREHEMDSSLDFAAREGGFLHIVDEGVHMMDMPFLEIPISGWTYLSTL